MDFREILTRLRLEKRMTQQQLADRAGVGLDTVVQWENGDGEPPIKDLLVLADVLEVSMDTLLGKKPVAEEAEDAKETAVTACPCCGRAVAGNFCLTCEFPLAGYEEKGPRYAIILKYAPSNISNYEEKLSQLSKYCGISDGEAAGLFEGTGPKLIRRGLTDVAAHWIGARLDPSYFNISIVGDGGESDEELAEKQAVMVTPEYVYKDNSIGVGGIILIVILTIIALSIL